jgi:aryl-alcohol dehydrogenase-like predicted oxidoreductase
MEMRELGRSGVKVSAAGLGVMTFGAQTGRGEAFAQLDLATEAGINFFDTAENYPAPVSGETQGRSEETLGDWVRERRARDRVVIATKVTGPGGMEHIRGAGRRLDRRNIEAAIEGSLRRLKTDYIDLYQLHWPDRPITTAARMRFLHIPDAPEITPLEESLGVLGDLVKAGKVRHIGVANETPWGAMKALALADRGEAPRIASIQNGYSLLDRRYELALAEIAMREKVGLLAYSPLAGGTLTGKYLKPGAGVEGSRLRAWEGFDKRYARPRIQDAAASYVAIAERHGLDPAAMALAFVRERPFVTSVLMAASSVAQLQKNLASLDVSLSRDVVREIDAVHDAAPNPTV